MPEVVYEPRAFWEVVRQQAPEPGAGSARVALNRENFRNGTRHPITLDRMLLAGVGYALAEWSGTATPPVSDVDRHTCSAAVQVVRVLTLAPQRQLFNLRSLLTPAWAPIRTADPSMRPGASQTYSSGLHNVVRWDFEKEVRLPRGYAIDFALGGCLNQPNTGFVAVITSAPIPSVAFFERGGLVKGSARYLRGTPNNVSFFMGSNGLAQQAFPFQADALGAQAITNDNTGAVVSNQVWPAPFSPTAFSRQQAGQAGSERMGGFAVHIDQIGYDDEMQNVVAPVNIPGNPIASVALRTPTRCRVHPDTGGSGIDWWREGAPLALVCPTMTPAQVYKLCEPITLHPGDTLQLEMEFPEGIDTGSNDIRPTYQIGVSFTGYAAIKG